MKRKLVQYQFAGSKRSTDRYAEGDTTDRKTVRGV